MARGALGFAEEKFLALLRVTGESASLALPLEHADISNDRVDLGGAQGMEGGHAGSGDAVRNDVGELGVGEVLHLGVAGDVWSLVTSTTIEAVASGASGGE